MPQLGKSDNRQVESEQVGEELHQWQHAASSGVFRQERQQYVISHPDDIAFTRPAEDGLWLKSCGARIVRVSRSWLAEEEAYGTRFLFIPVFAAVGAIVYFHASYELSWLRLLLVCSLFALLSRLSRHARFLNLAFIFVTLASLGALFAKMETERLGTQMLTTERSTFLTGRIVSLEKGTKSYRMVIDVLATEKPSLSVPLARVKVSARAIPKGADIGAGLYGLIRLRPPSGAPRPGSYDFAFYSYFNGISAQGFFMSEPKLVAVNPPDNSFDRLKISVSGLRATMTKRITAAISGEAGAISAALITGQRGGISEQTNEALRVAGLAHILSISGLHMAMVTGMVLVVLRSILALFPKFSSYHSPKKIAAAVALFVSAFYLMLSGSDVAAQRSFVMVAVMLTAVLCDRAAITMRNLAIAAIITIVVVPHEVLGPSFQMSFAATAALVAAFGWWSEHCRQKLDKGDITQHSRFMRLGVIPVVSTAVSSLVAGTASGVFAAYHFSNTAPLGILSNAIAFPVMSIAVMPFALVAAVLMPFHLEWLPLQIMGYGVESVKNIAFWVAELSPDFNPGFIPGSALILLSIGLVILLFMRTPLRFISVVPIFAGITLCFLISKPLALVSEDGRFAAVVYGDGTLAVNKMRPPAFILSNWRSALRITEDRVTAPDMKGAGTKGFICSELFCRAKLEDGATFAIVESPSVTEDI